MSEFKSNGARRPVHTVRRADRPKRGAPAPVAEAPKPGMAAGGSLRLSGLARPQAAKVTLPEIPSLARDIALTLEDGIFMHAVHTAAEAMLEGAEGARGMIAGGFTPLTIEEEGALARAFSRGRLV